MHHSSHGIRSKGGQKETHNIRTGNQEYDKMEEQNKKICKRRKNNGEGNTSHTHRPQSQTNEKNAQKLEGKIETSKLILVMHIK